MKLNDAVFGVVLLLFAGAILLHTPGFPEMPGQRYGPALAPNIIAIGMACAGVVLLIGGVGRLRAGERLVDGGDLVSSLHHLTNGLAVLAGLIVYILVADWLGFIPTAFLLMLLLMVKFRRGHVVSSAAISAATIGFVYFVFTRLLLVPLPVGLMTHIGLAW